MFVIPLMTCSARLPVFALLLTFLFFGQPAWKPGLTLTGLYIAALILGAIAAVILNKILKRDDKSAYMMELPLYRAPKLRVLLRTSLTRTQNYVKKAGPVIFVLAMILWTLSTFPNYKMQDDHERLQSSYAAHLGHFIEPAFKPMGLDWRAGVGLISAFAAREVFVSSMAVMYNVTEKDDEATMQKTLIDQLHSATDSQGNKIFTLSTIIGVIVFFLIALQCMSTTAIAAQEMKSWKFAMTQMIVLNGVAYVATVLVVHGLRAMGVS
jgi:ferrous iron transport protein B